MMKIDTTDTCLALDNAIVDYGNAAGNVYARSDLDRAIIAHADAEVARRLAAHDATWQAHDLERDAEVARWQGEAHALVRAIKSIAAAVGSPDVESGDGWGERVAVAVIDAIAADRERAVADLDAAIARELDRRFTLAMPVRVAALRVAEAAHRSGPASAESDAAIKALFFAIAAARHTPDEARRLVDAYGCDAAMHGALGATGDTRTALLRALGVEA